VASCVVGCGGVPTPRKAAGALTIIMSKGICFISLVLFVLP
jgi:hypothetical protein